jgi:hypothetical protein
MDLNFDRCGWSGALDRLSPQAPHRWRTCMCVSSASITITCVQDVHVRFSRRGFHTVPPESLLNRY